MERKKEGYVKNNKEKRTNSRTPLKKEGKREYKKEAKPITKNTRKPKTSGNKEEVVFKKEKLRIIPLRWFARSWKKHYSF